MLALEPSEDGGFLFVTSTVERTTPKQTNHNQSIRPTVEQSSNISFWKQLLMLFCLDGLVLACRHHADGVFSSPGALAMAKPSGPKDKLWPQPTP